MRTEMAGRDLEWQHNKNETGQGGTQHEPDSAVLLLEESSSLNQPLVWRPRMKRDLS